MPRQPRLDAPGLLHHVIARGVNRGIIFSDDRDREDFLGRLAKMLAWSGGRCFAWSLMSNHLHLLIQSGMESLGLMMQRILTGYAATFNRRHDRVGHLFQSRFKSIVCQTDIYFMELVRYIHLNPVRAGIVQTLDQLAAYPWTGHAVLMGRHQASWQEIAETLSWWGIRIEDARATYCGFLAAGLEEPEPIQMEQGFSWRSLLEPGRRPSESDSWDLRVLGDKDFAARLLLNVEAKENSRRQMKLDVVSIDALCRDLCEEMGLSLAEALSRSKKPDISRFRALASYRAVDECGWPAIMAAKFLGISEPSLSAARARGRTLRGVN